MARRLGILLLALAVACTPARPQVDAWEREWQAAVAAIPEEPPAGGDLPEAVCEDAVAYLRDVRTSLVPAPNDVLDSAVDGWLSFARNLFFECPTASGEHTGWAAGYEELARYEREIEELLVEARQP